ncbi:MAG: hypothetical protein LBK47_00695 [Prevotellaceae bacterium]|jgi:hypothetical protein|nr:hypothetical protein [Prevotellaceae bacterium]
MLQKIIAGVLLPVAVVLSTSAVMAQEARYDRATLSLMLVNHGDGFDSRVADVFFKIPAEDKFYHNKIGTTAVPVAKSRSANTAGRKDDILAYLNKSDAGLQELKVWFNRRPNGSMDMDLIHARGEFNATDQTFRNVEATKRGREEMKDLGASLMAGTYVMVYDFANLSYSRNTNGYADFHTYSSDVSLYIFRIGALAQAIDAIYDCWIEEEDAPAVRAEKNTRFDSIRVAMEYVGVQSKKIATRGLLSGASKTTEDELFKQLVQKGYKGVLEQLENNVAAFSVQTGVYSVAPITAKIGKKEGLRTDQRYNIYENVQKNDKIAQVRKGVVRVGAKITDNRKVTDGNTQPSEFYQIAGAYIEPGMTLKQHNDLGMSIIGGYGYTIDRQGQIQARVEQLLTKLLPIKTTGLYLYVEGEFEWGSYEAPALAGVDPAYAPEVKKNFLFIRGGLGIGRGYQPLRNLQVTPYIGGGYELVAYAKDLNVESYYLKAGANLTVNIYYPFQLVAGAYAYGYVSTQLKDNSDNTYGAGISGNRYSDYFKGRNPYGAAGFVGLRINF